MLKSLNFLKNLLVLLLCSLLSQESVFAFPNWKEEAIIETDHPRLATLDDEAIKDPALITGEVFIDPNFYDEVTPSLTDKLFGIKSTVIPPTFVVEVSGDKISLENEGLVLIDKEKEKQVVREFVLRWEYYDLKGMFNRVDKLGATHRFKGQKVASIATKFSNGYYHFMFDMLPRLRLLQKAGLPYDKLYVSSMNRAYVKEALKLAGIPEDKVISSNEYPVISADRLVLPSFPSISYQSTPWVIKWLQDFYLNKDRKVKPPKDLIYISRSDADKRRIKNERRLLEMLEILGFKKATLEGESVKEQALMYQNAKVIMGPHGAGFSNIIFSQPEATLIELMNPNWPHGPFAALAEKIGMKYGLVFGKNTDKKTLDYRISLRKTWLELQKHVSFSEKVKLKVEKYLTRYECEVKQKSWQKTLGTFKVAGLSIFFYHMIVLYFRRHRFTFWKKNKSTSSNS